MRRFAILLEPVSFLVAVHSFRILDMKEYRLGSRGGLETEQAMIIGSKMHKETENIFENHFFLRYFEVAQ